MENKDLNYKIKELERLKEESLFSRDSISYAKAINDLGYDMDSIENLHLYEEGLTKLASDESRLREFLNDYEQSQRNSTRQRSQKREERLYNLLANSRGVDVENVFENTHYKRNALKKHMGYKTLKGKNNIDITIDSAEKERVGEVYKNCINQARKYLSQRN